MKSLRIIAVIPELPPSIAPSGDPDRVGANPSAGAGPEPVHPLPRRPRRTLDLGAGFPVHSITVLAVIAAACWAAAGWSERQSRQQAVERLAREPAATGGGPGVVTP